MKKLILLSTVALLFIASCSDNDPSSSGSDDDNVVLLKKTIETAADGTQYTSAYEYDGTKITAITHNDGSNESYTYTNDVLATVRHYEGGSLTAQYIFNYNSDGRLATYTAYNYNLANPSNNNAEKFTYAYDNNTISVTEYHGDHANQTEVYQTGTLAVASNNVVSFTGSITSQTYSYDFANSPFKNVFAYNVIIVANLKGGFANQLTSHSSTGSVTEDTVTTYTYNADYYPVTATRTNDNGSVTTTQYTY